jgi:hypothetical protein
VREFPRAVAEPLIAARLFQAGKEIIGLNWRVVPLEKEGQDFKTAHEKTGCQAWGLATGVTI